jgi:predicted nucleic acid-binding protein
MAMMVADTPIFLDTNILLRFDVPDFSLHTEVQQAVQGLVRNENKLWISGQVIREFSAVLTRPQATVGPSTPADVAARLRTLLPAFKVAHDSTRSIDHLLRLMDTYPMGGKQIHDANIVSTMLDYKITHLFTLNKADFERFSPLMTLLTLDQLAP